VFYIIQGGSYRVKKKELARKITSWLTLGAFSVQPMLAFAEEILPDNNAPVAERPLVTETASGNPLVQITTPTAGGVSVNRYEFFNVPERGAILNVSSVAAHNVVGTYSAHKAWVLRFTEGLSVELAGTGVTATALCPGLVHTGFHAAAGIDETQWKDLLWLDAERVVSDGLTAVRRGQVICTPSLRYRSANAILRLAPRWLVRRMAGDLERSGRDAQ